MKSPHFLRFSALLAGLAALPGVGLAQDTTPPVVVKPLSSLTVAAGTTGSVINLKKTFGLNGVAGQVVRMATALGNIDIEMLSADSPNNVANFLGYVNAGTYNQSFIQRSIPGFIIQGGGYYVSGQSNLAQTAAGAMIAGEHKVLNTRGTIALALSNGPDSGTNQWFFNLVDNAQLDVSDPTASNYDGGPFTVFGRVIEGGLATMDAIAAVPIPNPSPFVNDTDLNGALDDIPLIDYDSTAGVQLSNLVLLTDVVIVPLVPPTTGADSVLTLKAKSNNTALVTATVTGRKLKLSYVAGQTGTAKIKVLAKDSAGTQTKSQFTVTVQ